MNRLAKLLALLTISAALFAAGCGGDDDEPSTTTAGATGTTGASGSATIDEWTEQADEICATGDRDQQEAATEAFGDKAPSQEQLEAFASDVVVPNLQEQYDAIAALPKPEAEAEEIDEMLSALQTGINQVTENPGALVEGADSLPAIAEATQKAEALGLTDCGS